MLAFVWRKISKNYKKKFDDVAIREVPLIRAIFCKNHPGPGSDPLQISSFRDIGTILWPKEQIQKILVRKLFFGPFWGREVSDIFQKNLEFHFFAFLNQNISSGHGLHIDISL